MMATSLPAPLSMAHLPPVLGPSHPRPGHLSPQSPMGSIHAPSALTSHLHGHRNVLPPFGTPTPQPHYQLGYDTRAQYPPPPPPPPPPAQQDQYGMQRFLPGQPMPPPPMLPAAAQAHKRAYRQRRKDPSCDACRERKVKCDATDTVSCSECLGRNVKCQFTKETNRRMSSIKQVQDLEKQLMAARQQVSQLQHMVKTEPNGDAKSSSPDEDEDDGPNKRRRLTKGQDLQAVARNMEVYGKDLIRLPTNSREPTHWDQNLGGSLPELPPKHVADRLLSDFKAMIYTAFPMFSWSNLMQRHEDLYKNGASTKYSQHWYALYFAVLCFGSLRTCNEDGRNFFQQATKLVDLWSCDCSMDAIRATLLLSMFQVESNNITSGFKTLGHCVRAAIDMGLHRRTEQRTAQEDQARLSLWWCIFSTERLFALELGRPSMIDDSDCPPFAQAIGYDLRPIDRLTSLPGSDPQFDFINQLARCTSHLQRAFKQPVISPETLEEAEEQIGKCVASFPPHQQPTANDYLDMAPSTPVVYVQNLRLMLHRHNLSPASGPEVRQEALAECLAAARETARLMSRTLHPPPATPSLAPQPAESSEEKLRNASSAFLCTHVWRSTLILACSGDFVSALHCAQASAAIGSHRRINVACGRYLEFVLGLIRGRRAYQPVPLHDDEELLAYASGDLQSNLDQAWVWQSSFRGPVGDEAGANFIIGEEELERWNRWKGIVRTLEEMVEEQRWDQERERQREKDRERSQVLSPQTPMFEPEKAATPATPSTKRMSIADLI